MEIELLPPEHVDAVVQQIWPYLTLSANRSRGRVTEDDILGFVRNGQMMLWAVHDKKMIQGHVVTEVKQYPQCKMLAIQYCAMTAGVMAAVEDKMQDIATSFAKAAGCAGIEFVGRPGWRRTARKYGYTTESVMYQKFFKEP